MRLSRSLWQQLQVDQTTWRALARALASARRAQHLEQRASDKGGWEVGDRAAFSCIRESRLPPKT